MKRALVFSGGGSRGSYEIGAWQALEETGLRFDMVYGVSIGAINAAMVAQGNLDLAVRLWDNLTADRILSTGSEQAFQIEKMFNRARDLLPFLLEHSRQLRQDITPMENLLREHLNEKRVRASGMEFGLIALKFPSLSPAFQTLDTIPDGRLVDWIIASASCFPVFPTRVVDGDRYIDGGYFDNLPVDMALRAGAEEVLAVDIHSKPVHPEYLRMPFFDCIAPLRPLGNFLDFHPETLRRNRRMGYYDAMKHLGLFDGVFYTFTRLNEARAARLGRRFMHMVSDFDSAVVTRAAIGSKEVTPPLIHAIESGVPVQKLSWKLAFVRGLELAAAKLNYVEAAIYDADDLLRRMLATVRETDLPKLESEADVLALARLDDRAFLSALYRWLEKNVYFPDGILPALSQFPEHVAAAMFLCAMESGDSARLTAGSR